MEESTCVHCGHKSYIGTRGDHDIVLEERCGDCYVCEKESRPQEDLPEVGALPDILRVADIVAGWTG